MAQALQAQWRIAVDSPVISDAQLLVTELMTNALNAGTSMLEVAMNLDGDVVRLSVLDDAPGGPMPRSAEITDEHGRGLSIVAALGQAWGVEYREGSKSVWVDLPFA